MKQINKKWGKRQCLPFTASFNYDHMITCPVFNYHTLTLICCYFSSNLFYVEKVIVCHLFHYNQCAIITEPQWIKWLMIISGNICFLHSKEANTIYWWLSHLFSEFPNIMMGKYWAPFSFKRKGVCFDIDLCIAFMTLQQNVTFIYHHHWLSIFF